jgi:hypothetical protein
VVTAPRLGWPDATPLNSRDVRFARDGRWYVSTVRNLAQNGTEEPLARPDVSFGISVHPSHGAGIGENAAIGLALAILRASLRSVDLLSWVRHAEGDCANATISRTLPAAMHASTYAVKPDRSANTPHGPACCKNSLFDVKSRGAVTSAVAPALFICGHARRAAADPVHVPPDPGGKRHNDYDDP